MHLSKMVVFFFPLEEVSVSSAGESIGWLMFDKMQCLPLPGGRGEFTWAQGDGVAGINLFEVLFSRGRICFMDIQLNFKFGVVGLYARVILKAYLVC